MIPFRRGSVFGLIAIILLAFSGCVENQTDTQAPGAFNIPVPIPGNYIQNSAIGNTKIASSSVNDTQLAANAIRYNLTTNSTETTVTGTTLLPVLTNGSITVSRDSALIITFSASAKVSANNSSYIQIQVNNVSSTPTLVKGIAKVSTATNYGAISFTFYNSSVPAGTYIISPFTNVSDANGISYMNNVSLVTIALPK